MWAEIENIGPGEHVGLFYRNRSEQLSVVVPYVLTALKRNERCLYIVEENSVGLVLKHLRDAGANVDSALDSGALRITTKSDTYLRHGIFQPTKMVEELRLEVNNALASGFTGFRGSGEMSWALSLESTLAQLTEYEAALHKEFPAKFVALCQYNETTFPPRIISEMIRWHHRIVARGRLVENPFFVGRSAADTTQNRLISIQDVLDASDSAASIARSA